MLIPLLVAASVQAQEIVEEVTADDRDLVFKEQPIDHRRFTDLGAYTLPQREVYLGLTSLKYGLLDNLQVELSPPLLLLGIVGIGGKVDAITTDSLDVSLEGGVHQTTLALSGGYQVDVRVVPVAAMASWNVQDSLNLHGGLGWLVGEVDGEFPVVDLADSASAMLGVDIATPIKSVTNEGNALYGGARLALTQLRLAADLQLNGRDALVFESNTWLSLKGRLDAGYAFYYGYADASVGAAAEVGPVPLRGVVATTTTLSWQFTWRYVHLRLGLPLPSTGTGEAAIPLAGWTQANKLWIQF